MFQPSRECSMSPFQIFSLSWSRYHSATPCLTRRTNTVVALTPSISAGSSVANSGIPCRDSSFSSFEGVEHVPARPFDVLAHDGGEPEGRGGGFAEHVGHAAVAGQSGVGELPVGVAP